jgi:hypothetical protein
VSLLFEEWSHVAEGQQLQRVWIRIYRLPQMLREFLVLWVLGSMLGATQLVDMISSRRNDYGHAEVAILNVDILPNRIDSVVIGDRLYSLPIQVEGRGEQVAQENQMDVDHGNHGVGSSKENKEGDKGDGNSRYMKEKEQNIDESNQPEESSPKGKQTDMHDEVGSCLDNG